MSTTRKNVIQKGALWLLITILVMSAPFAAYATASSLYPDHTITIYGSSSVWVYNKASESQFSAILRSPSGEVNKELVWSVNGLQGVTITQTGLLQLDPSTKEGTALISVSMKEDASVVGTRSVALVYHSSKTVVEEPVTTEPVTTEPVTTEPVTTEPQPVVETDISDKASALVEHLTREVPKRTSHVRNEFKPKHTVSKTIANYVITWQLDYEGLGGWGKNFDDRIYTRNWNGTETKAHTYTQGNKVPTSSIDNNATTSHIQYLAAVYGQYGGSAYKNAIHKATDMILHMQHDQGSWGEMYPEQTYASSSFENRGTILQMVHYNVMSMYQKILTNTYPFNNDVFDAAYKQKIQKSYDKALDFVIKSQVEQKGVLTGWAGKYNEAIYEPRWARSFEPPSIVTFDTAMILFHLISIPDKSDEVVNAIYHGAMFMHDTVMLDMKYSRTTAPYFLSAPGEKVWYKFLELGTNRGIVAENRTIYYKVSDLSAERIAGYGWGSERGFQFYDETEKFLASYQPPAPVTEPAPAPVTEPAPAPEPEPVEEVSIYDGYTLTIYGSSTTKIYPKDARTQYSAILRGDGQEITGKEIIWSVSGDKHVSIDQNGLMTIKSAVKPGTVSITVKLKEETSVTGTFTVKLVNYK